MQCLSHTYYLYAWWIYSCTLGRTLTLVVLRRHELQVVHLLLLRRRVELQLLRLQTLQNQQDVELFFVFLPKTRCARILKGSCHSDLVEWLPKAVATRSAVDRGSQVAVLLLLSDRRVAAFVYVHRVLSQHRSPVACGNPGL